MIFVYLRVLQLPSHKVVLFLFQSLLMLLQLNGMLPKVTMDKMFLIVETYPSLAEQFRLL